MAGFDYARARTTLNVPDDFTVEAMAAIGRIGPKEDLPQQLCRASFRVSAGRSPSSSSRDRIVESFRRRRRVRLQPDILIADVHVDRAHRSSRSGTLLRAPPACRTPVSRQRDAGHASRPPLLTADPVAIVQSKGARTEVHDARNGVRIVAGDALAQVGALLRAYRCDALEGLPPFQGGAAGYLAYDWGRVLERIPENRREDLGLPDAAFGIYDWVIGWDHRASRAWLISTGIPEVDDAARAKG